MPVASPDTSASRSALLHGALDTRDLVEVLDATDADVLAEQQLVLIEVLEHDTEAPSSSAIPGAQVLAVEEHAALGRLVQTRDELHERRLARAVLPDQRDALPRSYVQGQAAQREALSPG